MPIGDCWLDKKIATLFLAACMMFSAAACGNGTQKYRESITQVEELPKDNLGVDEPGMEIDTGAELPYNDYGPETSISESAVEIPEELMRSAYEAFLDVLETLEIYIRAYKWMNQGRDDSGWLFPVENIPCAIADVTGDGLEELIVMKAPDNNSATLEVYTYNESTGKAENILTVDDLNAVAGGGCGDLIAVTDEGKLLVYGIWRDESTFEEFSVYSFDGNKLSAELDLSCHNYPNDDYTAFINTCKLNDVEITKEEFVSKKEECIRSINVLLQYAFLFDDEIKAKVAGMPSDAMTYMDMHTILSKMAGTGKKYVFDMPDSNKIGYVTESRYGETTEDNMITVLVKQMGVDFSAYDGYELVYLDEVTNETLEQTTSDLIDKGCRTIAFDLGSFDVYEPYRKVLVREYPDVLIIPMILR